MNDQLIFHEAPQPIAPSRSGRVNPRHYQVEARDAAIEALRENTSTLIVQPTGTGKSVEIAMIAEKMLDHGRVLLLAHRRELIDQLVQTVWKVSEERCAIEMAKDWADLGSRKERIVVSSIQTMISGHGGEGRMKRFDPKEFSLVVVDEAHHAPAQTYRRVIEHFLGGNPDCRLLGVTATPDRKDELAMGSVFDTVCYDMEIVDAIEAGWIVPIRQRFVNCEDLDFSNVRTTAGDLNAGDLDRIMNVEKMLHQVCAPTNDIARGRKLLLFTTSVAHAERCSEILNRYEPNSSEWVCGATNKDERRWILKRLATGATTRLANVDVATEGFDEPTLSLISCGRPTKSRARYAQMIGRGTRVLPGLIDDLPAADDHEERRRRIAESAKQDTIVLDFVGNSGRHELASAVDILAGNEPEDVVKRAKKIIEEKGHDPEEEPVDIDEALIAARKALEDEKIRQRRLIRAGRVKYSQREVDPFSVLDITVRRERGWDVGKDATKRQLETLKKFKVDIPKGLTKSAAGQLLDRCIHRIKAKKCSYAQAKTLARFGEDPDMSFAEASATLDKIQKNGWKPLG